MSETNEHVTKKDLRDALDAMEERIAAFIAAEVGSLHTEIHQSEARLNVKLDDMDRRLRRVDTNTLTTMELLTRQSRWHEESDNAIHDVIKKQTETDRKVDELRGRIEKLEKAS